MSSNQKSPLLSAARRRLGYALVLSALGAATACSDDDDPATGAGDGGITAPLDGSVLPPGLDSGLTPTTPGDGGVVVVPPTPVNSLFAISTWITANEITNAYVKVVDRLDVDSKVDIKSNSVEVPGYGDTKVLGNKLYVSNGSAPEISSYTISDTGTFAPEGKVDFSQRATAAAIYRQAFVSNTSAYLTGDVSWVRWNPSTMKIEPEKEIPFPTTVVAKDNIKPFYSFDRGFAVRGNRLYQSIYWTDFTNYKMTATSAIAVIDTDNSKLLSVLEAPCPGLDSATMDDQGNIYFSGWTYNVGATVINGAAKGCAVRIAAGSDVIDPSYKLNFAEITGGHEAIGMRYIGNNKFLIDVFREDRDAYNPAADTIGEWLGQSNWVFATYDAVTREYKELPGLGYHSGGYYSERLGDQFFLLVRSGSGTDYIQLLADGTGKKGISVDGWATRAYKIR